MSETTSTTDGIPSSDAPSSSAVDQASTPAPATSSPDSSAPASSTGTSDATPSPSSGDSRRSDRDGLLAVVRSVVEKPAKPASEGGDASTEGDAAKAGDTRQDQDAASGATGDTTQRADTETSTQDSTADLPDPTEADLRKLRPETRRRFEQLLRQRNEARTQFQALEPEIKQHRELQGYLQQHQLAPEDVNVLLGVGAALRRRDFQAFLDGVTPYVQVAQEALGLRISADLQKQVDDGTISEDAARELTRTRHRAVIAEQDAKATTATLQTDRQAQTVAAIRTAVERWETGIRTRDPDYAQKADTVRRFSQGLLQERGVPTTPETAVALVQSAYEEVNKTFGAVRPQPRPTRPTPSSVHVATHGVSPEPKTMKEAALQALANMRRAS